MDFDLIEELTAEEINELYDDIAEKDRISACGCELACYVIVDGDETISNGNHTWTKKMAYCDDPITTSHQACTEHCKTLDIPVDEIEGAYLFVYSYTYSTVKFAHVLSSKSSVYGYLDANWNQFCLLPENAECSGDNWSRTYNTEHNAIQARFRDFSLHCTPEE